MALVFADRVKETTATTGTGTYTLAGAVTGFQSFSAIGNGNTCYYAITDNTNWEVGIGTYTSIGTTLARTRILASTNSNNAVNWGAGSKNIWCDYPANVANQLPTANGGGAYVADRTALAVLDTTKNTSAWLMEAGREGRFQWNSANLSALVTIDTQQGIYVAPASAPTGASGAWVRVYQRSTYTASWFGVLGDGSNQTTALQALIDFIPAAATALGIKPGGIVYVTGDVLFTTLSLLEKADITFRGSGGLNAGAGSACSWHSSSSATRVIDCRSSVGLRFEGIDFTFSANAPYGFDFGRNTSGANTDGVFMSFSYCSFFATGASVSTHVLSLDGATRGYFEHCNFSGTSNMVWGRYTAGGGAGFSNVMAFVSCNFQPSSTPGNTYPVNNPGETWSFINCTFEGNSAVGYQQGIQCNEDATGLLIQNCWFGDATANGGQNIVFQGTGLTFIGNILQGFSNSGNNGIVLNDNASGITIHGNRFNFLGNCVVFGANITDVSMVGNTKGANVGALTSGSPASGRIMDGTVQRLYGNAARGAPITKTANFTVADTENWLINNKSGSSCTVTLPAAASYVGREIMIKTIQAQTTVSASSNVVPLGGGAAGTAILSANAGRWATLVSNGTNWEIMAGVV